MPSSICKPTDHLFEYGGDGNGTDGPAEERWEAWLYCRNCGAIGMVPETATTGATILPPKDDGQGS